MCCSYYEDREIFYGFAIGLAILTMLFGIWPTVIKSNAAKQYSDTTCKTDFISNITTVPIDCSCKCSCPPLPPPHKFHQCTDPNHSGGIIKSKDCINYPCFYCYDSFASGYPYCETCSYFKYIIVLDYRYYNEILMKNISHTITKVILDDKNEAVNWRLDHEKEFPCSYLKHYPSFNVKDGQLNEYYKHQALVFGLSMILLGFLLSVIFIIIVCCEEYCHKSYNKL